MRKFLTAFCVFFLSACATSPVYHFQLHRDLEKNNGVLKTIYFENIEDGAGLDDVLYDDGWETVRDRKKANYIVVTDYRSQNSYQYKRMPIVGRTGISSIRTNHTGNIFGGNGLYNYSGMSTSYVNYDYGITGYVPYTEIKTNHEYFFVMYNKKTKNRVLFARLSISGCQDYISRGMFSMYAGELIANKFNEESFSGQFRCGKEKKGGKFCEMIK